MPNGLVIMQWNEKVGAEIYGTYPPELSIQTKSLMQLYSQHEYSSEAGFVTLSAGPVNLASYYTGPDSQMYVVLVLSGDEDSEVYEEALAEAALLAVSHASPAEIAPLLPSMYQRLSVYPSLNEEQHLSTIFSHVPKRMMFNRLQTEIAVSKSEFMIWMKDQYLEGIVDIEAVLKSMIKLGLVKLASVSKESSDMVFLVNDIMVMRVPPKDLVKDPSGHHLPSSLKANYLTEVRHFFQSYTPTDDDNVNFIDNILLDPEAYEVFQLLREAMVTRNDLEKLKKKGVEDVDAVLKKMWGLQMLGVFQDDNGTEYYCLISDFGIKKFYPKHIVNTLAEQYRGHAQNNQVIVKALQLLKEEFYTK